jgi:hypothetical protein
MADGMVAPPDADVFAPEDPDALAPLDPELLAPPDPGAPCCIMRTGLGSASI